MTFTIGSKTMTLNFPNNSRSFDAIGNRVRFWGYDSTMEISFFIEADALLKLRRQTPKAIRNESEILKVFDAAREQIYKVADKVHSHARKGSYAHTITAKDF